MTRALCSVLLFVALPFAALRAQDSACTYQSCAVRLAPVWNALDVVQGAEGRRVAGLGFFWVNDIRPALAVNDSLSFNELKRLLETTDGNLSVHARKLEDASYIVCSKSFEGRLPRTEYRLSPLGRRALERYLDHMDAWIHSTRDR